MNKAMGDYIAGTHDLFGVAIDPPQSTETDTPPSPNTPPPSSVTTPPQSIEPSPPPPLHLLLLLPQPHLWLHLEGRKGNSVVRLTQMLANQNLGVRFLSPITVIVLLSY